MDRPPPTSTPGTLQFEDGVAWLTLDQPGKKVNTLSGRTLLWLDDILAKLEANGARGLVIRSGKPSSFVVGADLEELATWTDSLGVERMLARGHALMARLEALPFPTVAAIDGACLGGGLELALACQRRVATDHEHTRLGLPEVQLGLIPGLGGTQRLPRLIGALPALELLTTGRKLNAASALRLGVVDETCHSADLRKAALRQLRQPARRRRLGSVLEWAALIPGFKNLIFALPRRRVRAATHGHYPAPLAAVNAVVDGLGRPLAIALALEAASFARLVVTPEAKRLVAIFFMKNDVEARAAALGRGARPVSRLAVVGAGFMGSGIGQLAAEKGFTVALKERDLAGLARGMAQASAITAARSRRERQPPSRTASQMRRLRPTLAPASLRGAELVVEAAFEDLAVKRAVLAEVEAVARGECVFASNTSTLPIGEIAAGCRFPERVVGMHFFSPVAKMPLLEIIRHRGTSDRTLATAVEVGRRLGKTVIVVRDGTGFYTTRVLSAMLNEATWCLAEGARIDAVDEAMVAWGWPVGPLTLMDEVGLDVGAHVATVTAAAFGERVEAPPVLARLIAEGRYGRKSGRGFYRYDRPGKKRPDRDFYRLLDWQSGSLSANEITERCCLALVNETARAMSEGVIENPMDVDIGATFGFGFPAFRGGPLREVERLGLSRVVERLAHYHERLGPRFEPAPRLVEMAAAGSTFYRRD